MPKNSPEFVIDRPYDLSLRRGTGTASSGSSGSGGGTIYTAGTAIEIDGSNAISVKLEAAGAVVVGAGGGLQVDVSDGIKVASNALTLNLDTDPGIEYNSGAVRVKIYADHGLTRDSNGVYVQLATNPGLEFSTGMRVKLNATASGLQRDSNGLALADSVAGNGLTVTAKVLAVGGGDGIDVAADSVAVDVTDFIDTAYGLTENSNNIRINLATNSGLTFSAGTLTLGTPGTLTYATTNSVSTSTHYHAVTASSDVGSTPAQSLLKSNASGQLTLAQLTLYGNLIFAGGNRAITASNNLTISPSTDLILDPSGLITMPNAQEFRTSTINDLPTGIDGIRFWNRYANYNQLTIGAIKADELYVRVFVADETRIDRGEEYWSKSFGVVQEDFTLPAVSATVNVWFEDAPGMSGFDLFSNGDYLLCRTIDWGTGLVVQKIWFQVTDDKLDQETTDVDGVDRQQWELTRIQGGIDDSLIKRGNLMLDAGVVGQGWVHLSALEQDGGPFIQVGEMTSISTVPQFTNYVRMGNLNGTVDYSSDTFGFAAGSGSGGLGTTPSSGFSGATVDATNGMRLFNVNFDLYDGSDLDFRIEKTDGVTLKQDTAYFSTARRVVKWVTAPGVDDTARAQIGGYRVTSTAHVLQLDVDARGINSAISDVRLYAYHGNEPTYDDALTYFLMRSDGAVYLSGTGSSSIVFDVSGALQTDTLLVGNTTLVSVAHVYENTSATGTSAGLTIEQDGTGDAVLQWLLTGGRRWVMGIDNSDSDSLKISATADVGSSPAITITTAGYLGINTTAPATWLDVQLPTGITTNQGLQISGQGGGYFQLVNTSGISDRFSPSIVGRSSTTGNVGLNFTGELVADSGSNYGFLLTARTSTPAALTAAHVFVLRNHTTVLMTVEYDGKTAIGSQTPASPLHVYENTSATGTSAGLTIEQDGTGDAVLQWLLTGGTRWSMGPDNSDSDSLKISPSADVGSSPAITITTGLVVYFNGAVFADSSLDVGTDLTVGDDIIVTDDAIIGGNATIDERLGVGGVTSPGAWIDLSANVGGIPLVRSTNYGTSQYHFLGRTANGTLASPTQAVNGTNLMSLGGLSYTSSGWAAGAGAEISFQATQSHTSSARGTKILFYVTKNSTTSASIALDLGNDREFYAPGVDAHTTAAAANVNVETSSGWLRRSTSSRRYKTDIRAMPDYGDLFDRLEPIVYKPADGVGGGNRDYPGLIAEDVLAAGGNDFVTFGDDGRVEYVMYDRLVVLTIGEMRAMKREIADLKERVSQL